MWFSAKARHANRANPLATPQADGEPDLPIDSRFLKFARPKAMQEPDEMEW